MKKRTVRVVSLMVSFAAVFLLAFGDRALGADRTTPVGATGKERLYLRLGSVGQSTSNYAKGVRVFIEKVAEYSNDEINVEYFGDSLLGGERDMAEGVGMGTFEMCLVASGPLVNFAKGFKIFDLPYIVTDRQVAYRVMDGEIGRQILDELQPSGIYALDFWENGFRMLYNSTKPLIHPEDLKGLKIRTMENEMHIALFNFLGAYATPIAGPELFTSLQQGVVDGHENPLNNIISSRMYEAQKFASLTGHLYSPAVLMINKELWDSLSPEDQTVFRKASAEARDYERKLSEEGDETQAEELQTLGLQVDRVDVEEWRRACEPIYDQFADQVNMDHVRALGGK
jgi:tripartite ATP-independent transporter DctP family solute receptor